MFVLVAYLFFAAAGSKQAEGVGQISEQFILLVENSYCLIYYIK